MSRSQKARVRTVIDEKSKERAPLVAASTNLISFAVVQLNIVISTNIVRDNNGQRANKTNRYQESTGTDQGSVDGSEGSTDGERMIPVASQQGRPTTAFLVLLVCLLLLRAPSYQSVFPNPD